jgi:hypothetical protein
MNFSLSKIIYNDYPSFDDTDSSETRGERLSRSITESVVGSAPCGEERPYVSNHSGYSHKGSENWEHDDTGCLMNYSAMDDMMNEPLRIHEGWESGYDY